MNIMKPLPLLLLLAALSVLLGCGGGTRQKQNRDFFTSGSKEADQRASQRMAKDEQLTGTGEGGGEKGVKKAKPVADGASAAGGTNKGAQVESKLTLCERLGGEKGVAAIVADFTQR